MKKVATIMMALAIVFGAFGAHYLKDPLDPASLESFKTGVLYHLIMSLGLLHMCNNPSHSIATKLLLAGTLCFSGSLYLLATQAIHHLPIKFLGPLTPFGGVLMITSWLLFAFYKRQ